MPSLALPTFFTQAVGSAGARSAYQSNHSRYQRRDGSSNLLPSRLPIFRNGIRSEHAVTGNGPKHRRITVADISKPKLLYGTGPFAWDFSGSGSWNVFGEDAKTLVHLENRKNPFVLSEDDDLGQSAALADTEDVVSPEKVDFVRTRAVSCSRPKTEHVLRLPTEHIVEYRFDSRTKRTAIDNDPQSNSNDNPDTPSRSRSRRLSDLIAEIEKAGNSFKELVIAREGEEFDDMEFNPYDEPHSEASSFRRTSEGYDADVSSHFTEVMNTSTLTRRETLRVSRTNFMTKEDAQRILLERRTDMQRNPDLRFVIPNPFSRDPCTFDRASAPMYPLYVPPRPESIEKLRKCLMKQFNAEDLYRPAVSSLLVPGAEFRRPKSIHQLSRRISGTGGDCGEVFVPVNTVLKRRSSEKLLIKVLRRAYFDAVIASASVAPVAASGGDPFADPYIAQPFDNPWSSPPTTSTSPTSPPTEKAPSSPSPSQDEKLDANLTETPATVKRKSSISAQLSTILKRRTSIGTVSGPGPGSGSGPQPSSEETREDGLLPTSSSTHKADKTNVRVNQVVGALVRVASIKKEKGSTISAQQSEEKSARRRSADSANKSSRKRRGLSDISNKKIVSTDQVQVQVQEPSASRKQEHEQRTRRPPPASLALSENSSRHKRTPSINSAESPFPPRVPPPALCNSRPSVPLGRPFRV